MPKTSENITFLMAHESKHSKTRIWEGSNLAVDGEDAVLWRGGQENTHSTCKSEILSWFQLFFMKGGGCRLVKK